MRFSKVIPVVLSAALCVVGTAVDASAQRGGSRGGGGAPHGGGGGYRGGGYRGGGRPVGGPVVGHAAPRVYSPAWRGGYHAYGPPHVVGYGRYYPYYYGYRPGLTIGFYAGFGYPYGSYYGAYGYPYGYYGYGYYGYGGYAYPGYGYGPYGYSAPPPGYVSARPGVAYGGVQIQGAPPDGQVFVDGYYIGVVDDFDGVGQHLNLEAGAHRIEIRLQGQPAASFDVNVQAGQTITYHAGMTR
jgi:hypothetical protein